MGVMVIKLSDIITIIMTAMFLHQRGGVKANTPPSE
jgi:hypothetical protein